MTHGMNNSWELTMRLEVRWVEGGKGGKMDNCDRITIKNVKNE